MSNESKALQIAFDTFTSDSNGFSAEDAMNLNDQDWAFNVTPWQPFENWDREDIRESIENLAWSIVEAFGK